MTSLDLIILLWFAFNIFKGLRQGLIATLASFLGWVIGGLVALRAYPVLLPFVSRLVEQPQLQIIIAMLGMMLGVSLCLALLGWLLSQFLKTIKLNWLNRLAGGVFGFAKIVVIVSIFIHILTPWASKMVWWQQSMVIQALQPSASAITAVVHKWGQQSLQHIQPMVQPSR